MSADRTDLLRRFRMQLFVATWLSYFGFYVVRKVYAVVKLPLKELKAMGGDCLVALLQVENAGPILGAAEYEML